MAKSIKGWPVMKGKCRTCPFGPNGDPQVREGVTSRVLSFEHSQICHHPALKGKPETHLCRGARDLQLTVLHAIGMIDEPTDAAFAAKSKEVLGGKHRFQDRHPGQHDVPGQRTDQGHGD